MESTRKSKIDRLVQKELSDIFQKFTKTLGGVLISVTSVSVSADLSIARVRLSIFPADKKDEMLQTIKKKCQIIALRFISTDKESIKTSTGVNIFH